MSENKTAMCSSKRYTTLSQVTLQLKNKFAQCPKHQLTGQPALVPHLTCEWDQKKGKLYGEIGYPTKAGDLICPISTPLPCEQTLKVMINAS